MKQTEGGAFMNVCARMASRFFVTFLIMLPVCFVNAATANILKCRHKIGLSDWTGCHCPEEDVLKCDLARAKEIVALISSKPLRSSFVNETGELGSIVKEVLISDKERKSEVEIRELIENMAILFTLNISDKNAETDIVMIFVTLGNHISYYGHENNKTIQKIKTMYQEIAEREIYLNKQLEEIGFMIRRPSELFPLLRKAIYRMRPDELPECPDIVERYSPEMCEVE